MTSYAPRQVSQRSGMSLDTLRYYERIGLIPPVARDSGGRRVYGEEHLGWLEALRCLRSGGMPVREMQRYVALALAGGHTAAERAELLERHRETILRRIADLEEALAAVDRKIEYYRSRG